MDKSRQVGTITTKYENWPMHWTTRRETKRVLTIGEGKLAQGFDLDFKLDAKLTQPTRARLIGKAVPPPFATDLFEHLAVHMRETDLGGLCPRFGRLLEGPEDQADSSTTLNGDGEEVFNGSNDKPVKTGDEFEGFDDKPKIIERSPCQVGKRTFDKTRESGPILE